MDIELIVGNEMPPQQVAEFAVAAEEAGVRTLWNSNITNGYDPFMGLVPAAMATSRIRLGPLAVSPYEMHPLKLGYALSTLNELSAGRAQIGLGGGGAMALWIRNEAAGSEVSLDFTKMRIVRGVREAAEIIYRITSGGYWPAYKGDIFTINRPFNTTFLSSVPRPQIISCSMGPQMLRMGGRIADGLQVGDVVPERMPEVMSEINTGLAKREYPAEDFRIGNFWAWHVKADREVSLHEARRKLFSRAELLPPYIGLDHLLEPDEAQIVKDNFRNFLMADVTGSGEIKNVPPELVDKLIANVCSAGGLDAIDHEIERFKRMEQAGITDLAIRVFDDPFDALKIIAERIIPQLS
jgi:alkanesulfonate monooxygenase SsuD/methylene tetrahydromethanopterin reductase-like flavin-dependent oxidoreductase (luciferase family)